MFPYIEERGGGIMETVVLGVAFGIAIITGFIAIRKLGIFLDQTADENRKEHKEE